MRRSDAAVELNLRPHWLHWLTVAAVSGGALASLGRAAPQFGAVLFLLWTPLTLAALCRLADQRWQSLTVKASGAVALLDFSGREMPAPGLRQAYRNQWLWLLEFGRRQHLLVWRMGQPDAFDRLALQLALDSENV